MKNVEEALYLQYVEIKEELWIRILIFEIKE